MEKIIKPKVKIEFLRIPYFLRDMQIIVDGKKRKLNDSELRVIAKLHSFGQTEFERKTI